MADHTDVLLEYWKEQRAHARHTESQRAILTNLILLIAAAGLGFISQQRFRETSLVVSMLLILLGVFGVIITWKYYERYNIHIEQAIEFSKRIAVLIPGCDHEEILAPVRARNAERVGKLKVIRLYRLWMALHFLIVLVGCTLTIVILA
jgi:hypothetical protein